MAIIGQGRHPAVARNWDFGMTSGKGTAPAQEQILVMFEIIDGPEKGRFIQWAGFFGEKSMKRTMESMRYCGWEGEDVTSPTGMDRFVVELEISHEPGVGENAHKTFARVNWVNRFGGSALKVDKPLDDKQKRLFSAKMKSLARSIAPVGGTEAPKPGPATAPPREEQSQQGSSSWSDNGVSDDAPPPRGDSDAPPPKRGPAPTDDIPF